MSIAWTLATIMFLYILLTTDWSKQSLVDAITSNSGDTQVVMNELHAHSGGGISNKKIKNDKEIELIL